MSKAKRVVLSSVLLTIIFSCTIYITSTLGKKIKVDATDENIYTLSKGTKDILKNLNTPLTIKLYYSKTAANKGTEGIRVFNNYYIYLKELLNEYVSHSRNNISLQLIDPRPDTEDEENAVQYGLKKFNITPTETYIFGMVIISDTGAQKVIEFFDPTKEGLVEYEISKLIYSVTHPRKKTVGVLSSLEIFAPNMSPYLAQLLRMQGRRSVPKTWTNIELLKELYELKLIDVSTDKIEGVDILLVVHPKDFSPQLRFAIDQYMMNGGKVLLFVDPHSVSDAPKGQQLGMFGARSVSSNLPTILSNLGLELVENTYVGDKLLSGMGRTSQFGPPQRLLPLLNCTSECAKKTQDILMTGLNEVTLVYPGHLKKLDKSDYKITSILQTTKHGGTYKATRWELNNSEGLLEKFQESKKPVTLGYRVSGKFKSAFPNGVTYEQKVNDPKNKKKQKSVTKSLTGLKEATKEITIIVFPDVDMLSDQFSFRQTFLGMAKANDNSSLFMNALESLSGSSELMGIRAKGKMQRPFDVINEIEMEAEKKTAHKVAQINANIQRFQNELLQLGSKASDENMALIKNASVLKKKELMQKIASLKKELREVKREGREKIEAIGRFLQILNTLLIPFMVFLVGVYIWYASFKRKRAFAGGTDE